VKGAKEGEGFRGVVLGAVVVDVTLSVKDKTVSLEDLEKNLVKRAEILAVDVSKELPDVADTRKKLVLGCMKKLKEAGVISVTYTVADRDEDVQLFLDAGLKDANPGSGGKSAHPTLIADLISLNPDPMKKMM
jgi:hypothetical protein